MPKRVLIVDDCARVKDEISKDLGTGFSSAERENTYLLRVGGTKVYLADEREAALSLIGALDFDAYFVDNQIPDKSTGEKGLFQPELVSAIRKVNGRSPIYSTSTHPSDKSVAEMIYGRCGKSWPEIKKVILEVCGNG